VPYRPRFSRLLAATEELLEVRRPGAARPLTARELRVEAIAASGFAAVAGACVLAGAPAVPPTAQTLALVAALALLSRVRFALGSGFILPTQLACVPLLLLLPPALAPALVGAALVAGRLPDLLTRRAPAERLLTSLADGWYVVAPATLLLLVAPHGALREAGGPVWLGALALGFLADLVVSTVRESCGAGVSPSLHIGVIAQVAAVDILLSAVGLLAAFGSQTRPFAFLLTLPLVAGLALFARERAARIDRALALADDLDCQRARVIAAYRRIGETVAANLDREALERFIVSTAVDLVAADDGRISARGCDDGGARRLRAVAANGEVEEALLAVEDALRAEGGLVEASAGESAAIGISVTAGADAPLVLSVGRRGRSFSTDERALLADLAKQAAVCLQNIALHEQVQRRAMTDEMTGLLNHRRMHEVLRRETRQAERAGAPLALVMLDIDNFKRINDVHGHPRGDAVLRAVADVLRASVRDVDYAARYGGEELAIVLPHTDCEEARALAERLREAVAELRIPASDGTDVAVTASFGVAVLDPSATDVAALIDAADAALYEAKRSGKNCVRVAAPAFV
jgi:diguanylate cyclase (GGDEF)-like protein